MNKVVSMTRQLQSISEAKTGKLHVFIFAQHLLLIQPSQFVLFSTSNICIFIFDL